MIDRTPQGGLDSDSVETLLTRSILQANVPVLLAVLVQLTGDERWLEPRYRTTRGRGLSDHDTGGLDEATQAEVRDAAVDAILRWRRGAPLAIESPGSELLARLATTVFGEEPPAEYLDMIASELDVAAPSIATDEASSHGTAVIIGAGISGLCAAIQLGAAGIDCVLLERNPALGGTWYVNRYPGCAVDTPSHLYSYSFAPHDWPHHFAQGGEVRSYLEDVATRFDLHRRIRFGAEVLGARFDEAAQEWVVRVRSARPGGAETSEVEELRAGFLVSAVGALSEPKVPAIPGITDFAGPLFHSAQWPADLSVDGKRVAVIGTGATAMQLVPAIAGRAANVEVFQRSAQWAAPFEKFHAPIPGELRVLLAEVPLYRLWYRIRLGWTFNDSTHAALVVDPEWPHQDRSVSAANERQRITLTEYLESEVGDDAELLAKVTPTFPPFGKRMLLDNGWFRTVARPDVQLESAGVARIVKDGVVTDDGELHRADVVVFATGFDAVNFLSSIEVEGRGGQRLHDLWGEDDASAYLGLMVPGFPNFFCLYGPNLQPGHGGSLIFSVECQVTMILRLIEAGGGPTMGTVECDQDAFDRYTEEVDDLHGQMIWTHPAVQTYYRNSKGRVVVNTPFRVVDYWHRTQALDPDAFVFEARRTSSADAPPSLTA